MSTHRRQSGGKTDAGHDAHVLRARIQQSQDRAKLVLEASKRALDAQSKQLGPGALDISTLFGHESIALPSTAGDGRKSLSPRPSFDPLHDDMQSTRKTIEPPEKDETMVQHYGRSSTRGRCTLTAKEMNNRSGARPVAANLNGTMAKDLSVQDILAGSRSERVRRMSQVNKSQSQFLQVPGAAAAKNNSQSQSAAIALFEQDENNFIAEIPTGFQAGSPPTCQTPVSKKSKPQTFHYSDAAKIPIELDDFGGEGYLLRNDFSFNQMCNKVSNRTDSICIPLERDQHQETVQKDSFFATTQQSHGLMGASFGHLENTMGLSMGGSSSPNSKRESSPPKLRGGNNLDGAVCLDCSKKCQCREAPRMKSPCASRREISREPDCRIVKDRCMKSGLKIECVDPCAAKTKSPEFRNPKDFCEQHLSYLDRVMKCLDLGTGQEQKKENCAPPPPSPRREVKRECDSDNEVQAMPARKAKSMVATDCCGNLDYRKFSDQNSCCGNSNNLIQSNNCDLTKAMSVCSQQMSPREGDHLRRAQSQMSSNHSEYNFVSGYLPLKSTHNEISWPSVKLRKSVTKSFQIKNTSPKRLIIRVILDGPGFNFQNAEANASGTLTLQPNEVRTLMLIFNPTVLGPAVGNLIFQPPVEYCAAGGGCATSTNINSPVTKRVIRLYGYGGHVAISFERLQQGPVGSKFLPLGNLCNLNRIFEETFIVRNKGNLTGFAAVMLENKTVGKSMFDHAISICPDKVLVPPNSAVKVKVAFQPTSSDMREMLKIHRGTEVIGIGNILIVTGDEPTRCRMKRLIKSSKELAEKYSSAQLCNIWADYGKHDCDYDLSELRETGLAVADLMGSFQSKEVALTVNNSTTDMSLIDASGWMTEAEDSDALFHTICQPGEVNECCVVPTDADTHMLPIRPKCQDEDQNDPCADDEWHVSPGCLSFNTNSVLPQVLTIHSRTSKNRMFEVDSNVANYFCVSPQEGVITPACDTTNISVRMMNYNVPECQLFIYIYIDNDRICVPVTVERGPPEGKATCPKISSEKVANLA